MAGIGITQAVYIAVASGLCLWVHCFYNYWFLVMVALAAIWFYVILWTLDVDVIQYLRPLVHVITSWVEQQITPADY